MYRRATENICMSFLLKIFLFCKNITISQVVFIYYKAYVWISCLIKKKITWWFKFTKRKSIMQVSHSKTMFTYQLLFILPFEKKKHIKKKLMSENRNLLGILIKLFLLSRYLLKKTPQSLFCIFIYNIHNKKIC